MKFNKKCVRNMYKLGSIGCLLLFGLSCSESNPELTDFYTTEYANLYESVLDRNGEELLVLTNHADSLVRRQSWRALIQTPVEDTDQHIQEVLRANNADAWASLWLKELSEKELNYLLTLWDGAREYKLGLLGLFAEQGNRIHFEFLVSQKRTGDLEFDRALSFAVGSISLRITLSEEEEVQLIELALNTKRAEITQAYLYGYYRGRKAFSSQAEQALLNGWKNYYPDGEGGDQFISRILAANHLDEVLYHFPIESFERMNVQLAVELIQAIRTHGPSPYSKVILNALLNHRNPHVKMQALNTIAAIDGYAESLFRDIMNKIALQPYQENIVRLEALNTIENPRRYRELVFELSSENPLLAPLKYQILKKTDSEADFMALLLADAKSTNANIRKAAYNALAESWMSASNSSKDAYLTTVRETMFSAISQQDQSGVLAFIPLYLDEEVLLKSNVEQLLAEMQALQIPDQNDAILALTNVLKSRFEDESIRYINSISSAGNAYINEGLHTQGWDIELGVLSSSTFRTPKWKSLARLGREPYLNISTTKGEIVVQIYVEIAPATVSGMDSLIAEGAYNGTPFHRVIPNFVIQEGDVGSMDGFGGPDYTVPTEASALVYDRGIVGIASSGTDTEGSQFFITHQFKPHLNGRYSIIGKVVEGMDVVDRITQADIITNMYWY